MFLRSLLVAVPVLVLCASARAEPDLTAQRESYKLINEAVPTLTKVTASLTAGDRKIALTGWMDGGTVRKIVAKPGNTGDGADEYYLEAERPVFVFSTYQRPKSDDHEAKKIEERIYFDEDGRIVTWKTTNEALGALHAEDYAGQEETLTSLAKNFVQALQAKNRAGLKSTVGTFLGIEEGDYFHWKMRTEAGEEVSYFMLRPDASLDRVVENPEEFKGRKGRVFWKRTSEKLYDSPDPMEVEQIVTVDWL